MKVLNNNFDKIAERNLVLLIGLAAVVSIVVVFVLYKLNFSGGFSKSSDQWSDFGGYFGGVLGPVVSFLTLVAVLKTVLMQREMIRLQNETFKSQIAQVDRLKKESSKAALNSRRSDVIGILDRVERLLTNSLDSMFREVNNGVEALKNTKPGANFDKLAKSVSQLQERIPELQARREKLHSLLFRVSMLDYKNIAEFDGEFVQKMNDIYPDFEKHLR